MPAGFIKSWNYLLDYLLQGFDDADEAPSADLYHEIAELLITCIDKQIQRDPSLMDAVNSGAVDGALGEFPIEFEAGPSVENEEYRELKTSVEAAIESTGNIASREALCAISLPSFAAEETLLGFLEEVHETIRDQCQEDWAEIFAQQVIRFVDQYNLPYRVRQGIKFQPLLTSEALKVYKRLSTEDGPHGDYPDLWGSFEDAYAQLVRSSGDCHVTIHKMFNLVEALAADVAGADRSQSFSNNLAALEKASCLPHRSTLKSSLDKLHGFTSDYPQIRHPGNPASKIRDLTPQDAQLLSQILFSWAGYLKSLEANAKQ